MKRSSDSFLKLRQNWCITVYMFYVYIIVIRHLCTLQSDHHRRSNYRPSPCNLSPSPAEPLTHCDHFLPSHSTILFPILTGASKSWIFLEFCCMNWLPLWLAVLPQGHVSSLFYKVSYLPVRFPTSRFFLAFSRLSSFHLPFFFYLHTFCILEFLSCHFGGIWKRHEKTARVSCHM